jgi:nicotinate-nucleotide adenylyltransferase
MRVGVLGGTFDPVHMGHLILAEQCREQVKLDEVWFIPAARPPHKEDYALSSFDHRLEMLSLAVAGQPAFRVEDLEKERPGPSYTVDTLAELKRRYSGNELFFIVGADCLPDLSHWYQPERLVEFAEIVVAARPGWPLWQADEVRNALRLPSARAFRFHAVHLPLIDISSRDLRQRVSQSRSIRYLAPRAVECYIQTHHLYANT